MSTGVRRYHIDWAKQPDGSWVSESDGSYTIRYVNNEWELRYAGTRVHSAFINGLDECMRKAAWHRGFSNLDG